MWSRIKVIQAQCSLLSIIPAKTTRNKNNVSTLKYKETELFAASLRLQLAWNDNFLTLFLKWMQRKWLPFSILMKIVGLLMGHLWILSSLYLIMLSTCFYFLIFSFGFALIQYGSLIYLFRFKLWSLLIKFILIKKY